MLDFVLTQTRLPEHFGWSISIKAYLDFHFEVDQIGVPAKQNKRLTDALLSSIEEGLGLRTEATENGHQIAELTGVFFKNFSAFDSDELIDMLEKETRLGVGTFDAKGGAHLAAKFLAAWAETEACDTFIDWDNFRPKAIFACDTLVCVPGVKLYPLLCRMLAELETHVSGTESILAVHQMFSTEGESEARQQSLIASFNDVAAHAELHGFRAMVAAKEAHMEGREMRSESHLRGFEITPDARDLATTIFALEHGEFNHSKSLWPAEVGYAPQHITRYLDPVLWIEHELGLKEHPRPAGSDIPRGELRTGVDD